MHNNVTIKINTIRYILLFIPFLIPASYIFPNSIFLILKGYRLIISVFLIIKCIKNRLFKKADVFLSLCAITILFSTFLYDGTRLDQLYNTISIIGFIALFRYGLSNNIRTFLRAILIYGISIVVITCITMFVYYSPNEYAGGMWETGRVLESGRMISGNYYLLGLDNNSFFIIFPMLCLLIIYQKIYFNKILKSGWIIYIFTSFAFFYVKSATNIVCFFVGLLWMLIACYGNRIRSFIKHFRIGTGLGVVIAFYVCIVVFRMQYYFKYLIVDILGKSLTLTRRTEIWDKAIRLVKERPILGIGAQSDAYNYAFFKVNHVHNIILQVLYEGGIIAMILFFAAIIYYCRKMSYYKKSSISLIISGAIIIYLLNTCIDFYFYLYMPYMLFILADNIDDLNTIYLKNRKLKGI